MSLFYSYNKGPFLFIKGGIITGITRSFSWWRSEFWVGGWGGRIDVLMADVVVLETPQNVHGKLDQSTFEVQRIRL